MHPVRPWTYPQERYYYPWLGAPQLPVPSDGHIKAQVVNRLRENPHTKGFDLKVDVKQRVVVLGGLVSSWLAKRAAGDDA
ncbi:BON domain-containing protein [Nonomuraea sp. 10N515B]|uniref:BON domain-containing protein n=1 Tax=Nonomuraea sp. 10N515B TaxID=3457422 RepID=UPI003FCC5FF0